MSDQHFVAFGQGRGQTYRPTDKQTDIATSRLNLPRGWMSEHVITRCRSSVLAGMLHLCSLRTRMNYSWLSSNSSWCKVLFVLCCFFTRQLYAELQQSPGIQVIRLKNPLTGFFLTFITWIWKTYRNIRTSAMSADTREKRKVQENLNTRNNFWIFF